MGGTPFNGPIGIQAPVAVAVVVTIVVRQLIQEIAAVRIVALDVGEIEEDLVVLETVPADLLVPPVEVTAFPCSVQVPGHVDKGDIRVVLFKLVHQGKVEVYVVGSCR